MILVFARKDFDLVEAGYKDSVYSPETFGKAYVWIKKNEGTYPHLEKDENLFITAHGNEESIGDEGPTLSVSAEDLAKVITGLLPGGYKGSIYISTCNSYKIAVSVKEKLADKVGGKVYGVDKSIGFAIDGPKGINWIAA